MDYQGLKEKILAMNLGSKIVFYETGDDTDIFVNKPITVPTKLKQSKRYDPQKNFQIGLRKPGQPGFLPNHLRILIDLYNKKQFNPKNADIMFECIEEVYNGKDPEAFKEKVSKLNFGDKGESPFTILCLAQLFMLEQDINYDFGKIQPPRSFLMGYIRMIKAGTEELDKLLWSSTRHPPRKEFRE